MDFLEEYDKNRNKILKEFYGLNYAEKMIHSTLSERTKAALYLKGKVQDVLSAFFLLHELIYDSVDNDTADKFSEVIEPLDKLADEYLILSIAENISIRDFEEI